MHSLMATIPLTLLVAVNVSPEHVNGFETHLLTSLKSNWV